MRDCLNDILNENCLLTLAHINQELRQRLPGKARIHDRTVARTLEGMLFPVKLARLLPAEKNRPDVIQKRVDYANWFICHAVLNHSGLSMNAAMTSGKQETKVEQEEGRGRAGKFVVKEEEMLRSHSPFQHQ